MVLVDKSYGNVCNVFCHFIFLVYCVVAYALFPSVFFITSSPFSSSTSSCHKQVRTTHTTDAKYDEHIKRIEVACGSCHCNLCCKSTVVRHPCLHGLDMKSQKTFLTFIRNTKGKSNNLSEKKCSKSG